MKEWICNVDPNRWTDRRRTALPPSPRPPESRDSCFFKLTRRRGHTHHRWTLFTTFFFIRETTKIFSWYRRTAAAFFSSAKNENNAVTNKVPPSTPSVWKYSRVFLGGFLNAKFPRNFYVVTMTSFFSRRRKWRHRYNIKIPGEFCI